MRFCIQKQPTHRRFILIPSPNFIVKNGEDEMSNKIDLAVFHLICSKLVAEAENVDELGKLVPVDFS